MFFFYRCSLRLIPVIVFLSAVHVQASAQQVADLFITGVAQQTSLEDYLSRLQSTTPNRFFYTEGLLKEVYLDNGDNLKPLLKFLDEELVKYNLAYMVYRKKNLVFMQRSQLSMKDQITMSGESPSEYNSILDIGSPQLAGKFKKAQLHGFVRNGKTGEALPGVLIQVEGTRANIITDPKGYYSLEIPVGRQEVNYAFVGFESKVVTLNMISPGNLDIELFEKTIDLDQVVITHNAKANVMSTEMSIVRLDARTVSSIPVLMGEPDLMKTMTLMPGVQSSGDLASGFNVRGGSSDQNLIMLDGVPIYNANHLFGMFSIVDASSIENLELHKGGVAARYGGRISSYMDIALKEGNMEEFEGDASAGLFSSKLALQGPLVHDRISYAIGGRTTYSDWILHRIPEEDIRNSSANFFDWNGKLGFIITQKLRLNVSAYQSSDYFDLADEAIYSYTNRLFSSQIRYIVSDKLSFFLNGFSTNLTNETVEKSDSYSASSLQTSMNQEGGVFRTRVELLNHSMEAGMEVNQYTIGSGTKTPYGDYSNIEPVALDDAYACDWAAYLQEEYAITPRLSVNLGLRYSSFSALGPATINTYSNDSISSSTWVGTEEYATGALLKNYAGWEPRMALRYVLGVSNSLKLGYCRTRQNLHILSNTAVLVPTDTWKSSDRYIHPAVADQVSLGIFHNSKTNLYETSAELYYKRATDVLEFKPGAILAVNPNIEQDVLSAAMQACGIELLLRKNSGRISGWVSYTYSRSFMQTSGAAKEELINRGEWYTSNYDKPHDVSVVANLELTKRLTLGSSFVYSTGRPVTYPENYIWVAGNPIVVYSDRNKYRLPDYHRLDVSLTWKMSLKKQKRGQSSWVLSVVNVYAHKNVYSTYYRKEVPSAVNNYKPYSNYQLAIIGIPIPSLTYNLKF